MKNVRLFYSVLLLLLYATGSGQVNGSFKEWGKVTISDLNIKECSFEKDADLILLLDLAKVYYQQQDANLFSAGKFRVTTSYYQRYKVLNQNGTKRANYNMRYRPLAHEEITDIKAASYELGPDGQLKKTELQAEDIRTRKLNEYENEVSFSIPGVKAGCVFELTHKRTQDVAYMLPSWYFSTAEPSLYCNLTIDFLDPIIYYTDTVMPFYNLSVSSTPFVSDIEIPRESGFGVQKLDGHEVSYTVTNMHSVKAEPYMSSPTNYTDHVQFQLSGYSDPLHANPNLISSFSSFNRYLSNKSTFGGNLTTDGIPARLMKGIVKDNMSAREKAKAIFEFIRGNMQWDGVTSLMAKEENTKVWKNKSGNSAEINMLLIIALRQAGLNADAAIWAGKSYGYPNTKYPILDQFRSLLVYVDFGDDDGVILDASDKYLPFGLTRYDALDNFIYLLRKDGTAAWLRTFNRESNSEQVLINASMDKDGFVKGDARMAFDHYTATSWRRAKATGNDKFLSEEVKRRMPGVNIESTSDSVDEAKEKFFENVRFSKQIMGDNDGNFYISLPDIYGDGTNPFTNKERISDVDFGYKQKKTSTLALTVPENYTIDSLIPETRYIMPDSSVSFVIQTEFTGGVLYIRQKLEYMKSFYYVSHYDDFYDFHQKYFKLIEQAIMLKKKK